MEPIPINSYINIFNFFVTFGCALVIFFRRKRLIWDNVLILTFFLSFFFGSISCFLAAIQGTLVHNPLTMDIIYVFMDVTTMLGSICLLVVPLRIFLKNDKIIRMTILITVGYALFYMIDSLSHIEPVKPIRTGIFIDWQGTPNPLLWSIAWALSAISLIATITLFAVYGRKHIKATIRERSKIFVSGFGLMALGWIASVFLFMILNQGGPIEILTLGSILGLLLMNTGMITVLYGIIKRED